MTKKEFEERMEEVKNQYGIPDQLCFRMDANFKIEEDLKKITAKKISLAKTAAAAGFLSEALTTNTEKDMQVLEAAMFDKGNYMYIVSDFRGIASMQIIHAIFIDGDGNPVESAKTGAEEQNVEDFIAGKLKSAFAKAADMTWEDGNAPNVLMRNIQKGAYEKINDNDGRESDQDVFLDLAVRDLSKMNEKERYLAMHVNTLFAEENDVPPERCFIIEVNDKDEAAKKLDEYMQAAGKELIGNTYSRKNKNDKGDFVYGADGKNCLVDFVKSDEKMINGEPYENLDDVFNEIVASMD